MRRELSLRLLRQILPDPPWTEDRLMKTVEQLRVLAEHKYNKYEMYQPARLFFESLYLFLARLTDPNDRTIALEFVRDKLIFVSREEFQQLAHILHYDCIRQRQLDFTSELTGIRRHRLRELAESTTFRRLQRASLYVALSDGARIDYFRRQNLDISNEQVLSAYYVSKEKLADVRKKLIEALDEKDAKFDYLFLLDDFCGSGRTLVREVVTATLAEPVENLRIPDALRGQLSYDSDKRQLQWNYRGPLVDNDLAALREISAELVFVAAADELVAKCSSGATEVKGSLLRIATESLLSLVSDRAKMYFCPLLATEYAQQRIDPLLKRLPSPLDRLELLSAATVSNDVRILPRTSEIANVCEAYYSPGIGDEHTGDVKFGYDSCGLPLVLHHNTPNNSIYLLWSRKWNDPLFVRYERHGREADS
jgi:hypothetical protein